MNINYIKEINESRVYDVSTKTPISLLNKMSPLLLSKTYTFLSNVPVAIAMLPAVAVTPPKFSVPVLGKPFFLR